MKKIWKMRRDSEAVSPVIATILMVAITVVLAAVLYVMVMGFGGPTTTTPTGSFTATSKLDAATEKVAFGVLTPDTSPSNLKILLEAPGGEPVTYTWAGSKWSVASGNATGVKNEIVYVDLADNDIINNGDYLKITLYSDAVSGVYRVTMLYAPTGSAIDDITFNW